MKQTVFKDAVGNIVRSRLAHPIYLSRMYIFRPKDDRIVVETSENTITVIGSGQVITPRLYPKLEDIISFGRPYDGTPHFRSWLTADFVSQVIHDLQLPTVGGPYWIWEILDPDRQSKWRWQWGFDSSFGNPNVEVEQQGYDFVVKNTHTGQKRTILHILNWTRGVKGALI